MFLSGILPARGQVDPSAGFAPVVLVPALHHDYLVEVQLVAQRP